MLPPTPAPTPDVRLERVGAVDMTHAPGPAPQTAPLEGRQPPEPFSQAIQRETLTNQRRRIFVTVGMGRWPFDRLLSAVERLAVNHDVFAQSGTSELPLTFPHKAFIDTEEFDRHLAEADIVITHAGNTVRRAQRLGKVPIVVAREHARPEMGNDPQERFLRAEAQGSPMVVSSGDEPNLDEALRRHDALLPTLWSLPPMPPPSPPAIIRSQLQAFDVDRRGPNPLRKHHDRRLGWAYAQLAGLGGAHLDVGCGDGQLIRALARGARRTAVGVEQAQRATDWADTTPLTETVRPTNPTQLAGSLGAASTAGRAAIVRIGARSPLPFAENSFASVSMLDVLEHVWDERAVLSEVRRVLGPNGLLVLSVPRRHVLSFMDPDNIKYRFPKAHRGIYRSRFGRDRYEQRFCDRTHGMFGEDAIERGWHSHYTEDQLESLLMRCGFQPLSWARANLLWRFADIPRLLLPGPLKRLTYPALRVDGRMFRQANLFVTARVA